MNPLFLLYLCVYSFQLSSAQTCEDIANTTSWDNSQKLNTQGSYSLSWKLSDEKDSITFMAQVSNQPNPTWIGLGISEVGHMLGSDVVTILNTEDDNGNPIVQISDDHVKWFPMHPATEVPWGMYPNRDDRQDVELICTSRGARRLMAIFTRLLDTGDTQDRRIVSGNNAVIFAWGVSSTDVHYHWNNRGSTAVSFFDAEASDDPADTDDHSSLIFSGAFTTSSSTRSQLLCQSFDLGEDERHIVSAQAVISGQAQGTAHHVILHACGTAPSALYALHTKGPSPCMDTTGDANAKGQSPLGDADCPGVLYGWARGSTRMRLPDEAGIPIGASSTRYVVVEIHFDNPTLQTRSVAGMGMLLATTHTHRQFNAGALVTGDHSLTLPQSSLQHRSIAAGAAETHFETSCSSTCTQRFGGDITVFSTLLHMHMTGKTIYLTRTTDTGNHSVINYRQFWNIGYQTMIHAGYVISPGDRINLHCTMDTTMYSNDVQFGPGGSDEMCMAYLFYYPVEKALPFCGYLADKSSCGGAHLTIDEENPSQDGSVNIPLELQFGIAPAYNAPSGVPSSTPISHAPTGHPSCDPSCNPSLPPSKQPTEYPSKQPTIYPSKQPTVNPSSIPTSSPSSGPASISMWPICSPTMLPSSYPTFSSLPILSPSHNIIMCPSVLPSKEPIQGSYSESSSPTLSMVKTQNANSVSASSDSRLSNEGIVYYIVLPSLGILLLIAAYQFNRNGLILRRKIKEDPIESSFQNRAEITISV